jgi:hypothetical protein
MATQNFPTAICRAAIDHDIPVLSSEPSMIATPRLPDGLWRMSEKLVLMIQHIQHL